MKITTEKAPLPYVTTFDDLARWCAALSKLRAPYIHKDFEDNPNMLLYAVALAENEAVTVMDVIQSWDYYRPGNPATQPASDNPATSTEAA